MSIILALPAQKLVLNAFTIFTGTTPSNATFNAHIAYVGANGEAAYTSFLNTVAKDIPVATLASNMLTNLGLTAVFTQAEAVAYLNSNASNLGGAMSAVATATLNYVSNASFAKNAEMLAAQTAWTLTATNALAYSSATTSTAAGSMSPTVSGSTYTLTTNADLLSLTSATAATKTTAGDDIIYATSDATLTSADIIDSGAGIDVILAGATANAQTLAPVLTNVETVTVTHTAVNAKTLTFDATNTTGLTTFNIKDAGAISGGATTQAETITLANLAKTTTLGIIGGTAITGSLAGADFTGSSIVATFTSAAAADTQKVAISTKGNVGDLTLATAETVEITATGTGTTGANTIGSLVAAAKTLNLLGSGDLTIGASDLAAVVTVNAADATGKITFTGETGATTTTFTGGSGVTTFTTASTGIVSVTTGAAADVITLSGASSTATVNAGAGNDNVIIGASGTVTSADSIVGGEGTDTITISDTTINATTKTTLALGVSGFEVLATTAAAEVTIDFNALSTYSVVTIATASTATAQAAAAATPAIAGLAAVTATIENTDQLIVAAARTGMVGQASTDVQTADLSGAGGNGITLTPKLDNGSNVASLKFVGNADITGGAGGLSAGTAATDLAGAGGIALSAAGIETLNIDISGTLALSTTSTPTTAAVVTFAGGAGGGANTGGTAGAAGSTVVVGTNATINLTSSLTGATAGVHNSIDLGAVIGTNVTINGANFLGAITASAGDGNVSIIGGIGKDVLTGGTGTDTLSGGAGADTLEGLAGADAYTGGAGRDSFAVSTGGATAGTFDTVADFGKATTALTIAQSATLSLTNAFGAAVAAATTLGGAEADALDMTTVAAALGGVQASTDVKAAVTGAVTINAVETAKGILTISGADAASVDTLAEWVAVANIMAAGAGNVVAFEFSGNSYVFQQQTGGGADTLVELTGVTGVTGIALIGASTAVVAGDIFVV